VVFPDNIALQNPNHVPDLLSTQISSETEDASSSVVRKFREEVGELGKGAMESNVTAYNNL
jgi:hypothetical protein